MQLSHFLGCEHLPLRGLCSPVMAADDREDANSGFCWIACCLCSLSDTFPNPTVLASQSQVLAELHMDLQISLSIKQKTNHTKPERITVILSYPPAHAQRGGWGRLLSPHDLSLTYDMPALCDMNPCFNANIHSVSVCHKRDFQLKS